jgi:hypothetical protein
MLNKSKKSTGVMRSLVAACCLSLTLPMAAFGDDNSTTVAESPTGVAITADLLARPVLLGVTVIGSAVWLLGLPFTALGGNVKQSADVLVMEPGKNTFVRCLGCTNAGYQH